LVKIHFRNTDYDAAILSSLVGLGHHEVIDTKYIMTLVAAASFPNPIVFKVDDKYHLLVGAIDPKQLKQRVTVITKFVLKKAAIEPKQFTERMVEKRNAPDPSDWRRQTPAPRRDNSRYGNY
jgi:hypothetical protein